MRLRESFIASLMLLSFSANLFDYTVAQSKQNPIIPATPAGQQLDGFLRAYNSGDVDILRKFITEHYDRSALEKRSPDDRAATGVATFKLTRQLNLHSIEESTNTKIVALCQSEVTEGWFNITIEVAQESPHGIVRQAFGFASRPADAVRHGRLSDARIVNELDAYLGKLIGADMFSGNVLVAKNGKPIFKKAYGFTDKASKTPNRIDTKFSIASLGKMFTSVAIAQLIQQGKLSISDSIGKLLPDYPNKQVAEKVRIQHLLSHTSGIGDYMDKEQYQNAKRAAGGRLKSLKDYLPFFANDPLLFEPGERDEYSNAGYLILGLIIEKASGQGFSDYVREHIFKPARMRNTESENITPAGGEFSTLDDMLLFAQALRHHKLLNAKYTEMVLAAEIVKGTGNAYGFEVNKDNGQRIVGHTGGYPGINAELDMYLDSDYSVVVLSNYDVPAALLVAKKLQELITQK